MDIESWKGKKFYVSRDEKGRVVSRRAVKGYPKEKAMDDLKRYGWFGDTHIRTRTSLTNVEEKTKLIVYKGFKRDEDGRIVQGLGIAPFKIERDKEGGLKRFEGTIPKRPKEAEVSQFYVGVVLKNGKMVYARSQAIGSPLAQDEKMARDRAWKSLYKMLGYHVRGKSDVGEGKVVFEDSVKELREGWIYYTKR